MPPVSTLSLSATAAAAAEMPSCLHGVLRVTVTVSVHNQTPAGSACCPVVKLTLASTMISQHPLICSAWCAHRRDAGTGRSWQHVRVDKVPCVQTLHGAPGKGGVRQRPDGDVELPGSGHGFRVPDCPQCGGILKPDVVYFGDNVPKHKALWAAKMSQECDALLILGTSCTTLSVFRLVRAVHERGGEVAAVNVGPTRADPLLSFSVAARVGEVLMRLATHDVLLLEPPAC